MKTYGSAKSGNDKEEDFQKHIAAKSKQRDKIVNAQTKQIEIEAEKRKSDEEKIEIMTQFMLDPTSSATKLLEKRREMYELQEALQKDKEKFIDKEAQFKKTEEELRMRDEEFHNRIVEYYNNSFGKKHGENESYKNKIEAEKTTQNQLKTEIHQLEQSNRKLKSDLEKMKEILDSLKEYEDFLKKVKEKQTDTYSEIGDIISKYKTLETTLKDLEDTGKDAAKKINEERTAFRNKKAEYENNINKIIGEINSIQPSLKDQKERKKFLENEVTQFEKTSNNTASSLEQILLAIQNIYSKCDEKKNWTRHDLEFNEKTDWTNPEQRVKIAKAMLKCINCYLEDYKDIEEKCRNMKDSK